LYSGEAVSTEEAFEEEGFGERSELSS